MDREVLLKKGGVLQALYKAHIVRSSFTPSWNVPFHIRQAVSSRLCLQGLGLLVQYNTVPSATIEASRLIAVADGFDKIIRAPFSQGFEPLSSNGLKMLTPIPIRDSKLELERDCEILFHWPMRHKERAPDVTFSSISTRQ
jgi:hypothetical protein